MFEESKDICAYEAWTFPIVVLNDEWEECLSRACYQLVDEIWESALEIVKWTDYTVNDLMNMKFSDSIHFPNKYLMKTADEAVVVNRYAFSYNKKIGKIILSELACKETD